MLSDTIDTAIHKSLDKAISGIVKVLTEKTHELQDSLKQATHVQSTDVDHMDVSNRVSIQTSLSEPQHQSPIDVIDEYMERERRKNNLIIHNFPESTTISENPPNDIQVFTELVKTEFNISEIKVTKAVRLKQTKPNKPRLLLVTLETCLLRETFCSKPLSTSWSDVFISPDLTPKECVFNRKLREELKAHKEAGEKDLYIRRGRIVTDLNRSSHKQNQST